MDIDSALPADFEEALAAAMREHALEEGADLLEDRIRARIAAIGAEAGLTRSHRSPAGWAARVLSDIQAAVHEEICAADGAGLKREYAEVLDQTLTREGITELAAVVLRIVRAINPALAVSTIGLYVAVWLLKVGLNRWCRSA